MTKLGIFVVTILAAAGAACDTEAWAAESVPTMASPAAAASAPKTCTGPWDFIETNWLRPVFLPILRWTGIGCRQHRHPPQPAKRPYRFEPSRPVVQRPRLCRRQFADLRHPDRFPAELADA